MSESSGGQQRWSEVYGLPEKPSKAGRGLFAPCRSVRHQTLDPAFWVESKGLCCSAGSYRKPRLRGEADCDDKPTFYEQVIGVKDCSLFFPS